MQPGVTVNERYEVLSVIGRGGMGVVFRARSIALQRDVAIKVFSDQFGLESTARAQREAKALAGVEHANLVRVHSLETDASGKLMLVFDYISGQPLNTLLAGGPLPVDEAASLFHQLCDGLQALHDHGFIHRDIKPSNLMIEGTADGGRHLTIIDFGLAKSTQLDSQKLTSTGTVLGTPHYMSPEQFACAAATPQSDMYSAACVLFEMICGQPPFENESPYMVANAHLTGTIPELPSNVVHAASLNAFFETALAKDPAKRFQSATEMWQSFCEAKDGSTAATPTQKAKAKARRKKTLNKLVFTGLIVTALALVVGLYRATLSPSDNSTSVDLLAAQQLHRIKAKYWDNSKGRDIKGARLELANLLHTLEQQGSGGMDTANVYRFYALVLLDDSNSRIPTDADKAVIVLTEAAKIALHVKDSKLQADVISELAQAYLRATNPKQCLECMEQVCTLRGKTPSELSNEEAAVMSHALTDDGDFDEALRYFAARAYDSDLNELSELNALRRDITSAYMWQGRYADALKVLAASHHEPQDRFGRGLDDTLLAQVYALSHRTKESRACLASAKKAFAGKNFESELIDFYNACEAVNLAAEGKQAESLKLISPIVAHEIISPPRTPLGRRLVHHRIWDCWLCHQAAMMLDEPVLADAAWHQAHNCTHELERQGCLNKHRFKMT